MIGEEELLYFADVCAAPGGFTEYVLWRRKKINKLCDAKGFGFTLKSNDFKLDDFFASPVEFFEPHYGNYLLHLHIQKSCMTYFTILNMFYLLW